MKSLSKIIYVAIIAFVLNASTIANATSLQDKHGIKDTSSLLLKLQMNLIPNAYIIHSFGRNSNVGTAQETLSETSVLYSYPMGFNGDAKVVSLISSGNDHGQVRITGLDALGNYQEENITLNDGISVNSVKSYSRLFDAYNIASTQLLGTIHISVNGTSIGTLNITNQKLYNAMYTIPKGYTGYLIGGTISSGKTKDITFDFVLRQYNQTFITIDAVYTYESAIHIPRPFMPIPELTDVEIRVSSTQTGSIANGSFSLLLVKNGTFN